MEGTGMKKLVIYLLLPLAMVGGLWLGTTVLKIYWYGWQYMITDSDARSAGSVVIRDGIVCDVDTQRLMVYAIYKRSQWPQDRMSMSRVVIERRMKVRPGKAIWMPHWPGFTNWWAQIFDRTQDLSQQGMSFVEDVRKGWKPEKGWQCTMWYSLGLRTVPDNNWFRENLIYLGRRCAYEFYRPKEGCAED